MALDNTLTVSTNTHIYAPTQQFSFSTQVMRYQTTVLGGMSYK